MSGECCKCHKLFEGTPTGEVTKFNGLDAYLAGDKSSSKVLLIHTDIYGHTFKNTQLVADEFAKQGFFVVVPDILKGDPVPISGFDFANLPKWLEKHPNSIAEGASLAALEGIKALKPKTIATIGYCYGAPFALKLMDGQVNVGAIAHPSLVSLESFKNVSVPLLMQGASSDKSFSPELRASVESWFLENGKTFYLSIASGCDHGFAIKGDVSIKTVKLAKEKSLTDAVWYFNAVHNGEI